METIRKTKHAEAHLLIDGFLQRNKCRHGNYKGDLYMYLGADYVPGQLKTRKALLKILIAEQNGLCCYCMRRLDTDPEEISIEHVIVNHPVDTNDYNQYLGKGSQLDTAEIVQTADFLANQTPPPPYPHSVAYENMLVSCAGHCHIGSKTPFSCNNYRCHRFVHPLPLMARVNNEVKYLKNGFVYWSGETDTQHPTVDVLGLNNDVLKL